MIGTPFSPQWKILLYDRLGQDLLSPIMNVKSLRDEGVTLHLLLVGQSERDPVPDVPAIYFCRPTEENLRRIAKGPSICDIHKIFRFFDPIVLKFLKVFVDSPYPF